MEQEQSSRDEVYKNLREAKSEKRTNYAKAVGWSMVPIAVFGGIGAVSSFISSPIESNDLRYLTSTGLGVAGGVVLGLSGMVGDYLEKFRDVIDDVKYSSQRVREGRNVLKSLDSLE